MHHGEAEPHARALAEFELGTVALESQTATLQHATDLRSAARVTLKRLRSEASDGTDLARLRSEFELLRSFDSPQVVRAIELVTLEGQPCLVLEALEGGLLTHTPRGTALDLASFLQLAISLTSAIDEIHRRPLLHRAIAPDAFTVSAAGSAQLIDLAEATWLTPLLPFGLGLSTLQPRASARYLAPEEAGVLGQCVDERSDLYSLGVVLYELLCGSPPFEGPDATLLRRHLTEPALEAIRHRAGIPRAISDILGLLLAKDPAQRYQSATALRRDLELCSSRIQGGLDALTLRPFAGALRRAQDDTPCAHDPSWQALHDAAQRAFTGRATFISLSGPEGTGKGRLARRLGRQLLARAQPLVVRFTRSTLEPPCAAFARGLDEHLRTLDTGAVEGQRPSARWVLRALGTRASSVAQLVPTVATLLQSDGPSSDCGLPDVHALKDGLCRLLLALIQQQPMYLFLRDAHWADPSSLELLTMLLGHPEATKLLVVASFDTTHVGTRGLAGLSKLLRHYDLPHLALSLSPQPAEQFCPAIAEILCCQREAAQGIVNGVRQLCQGYLGRVQYALLLLGHKGWLRYEDDTQRWSYHLPAGAVLTSSSMPSPSSRFLQLSPPARQLLGVASCIGERFELHTLCALVHSPPQQLASALQEALEGQILVPSDSRYRLLEHVPDAPAGLCFRFSCPSLCRLAYQACRAGRQALHRRLGSHYLAQVPAAAPSDLLPALRHLNIARWCLPTAERRLLARYNLVAARPGRLLKLSTRRYLVEHARRLLAESGWQQDYALTRHCYLQSALGARDAGRLSAAFQLLEQAQRRAATALDRAQTSAWQVGLLVQLGDLSSARQQTLFAFDLLGLGPSVWRDAASPSQLQTCSAALLAGRSPQGVANGPAAACSESEPYPPPASPSILVLCEVLEQGYHALHSLEPSLALKLTVALTQRALQEQAFCAPLTVLFAHAKASQDGDWGEAWRLGRCALDALAVHPHQARGGSHYLNFGWLLAHFGEPASQEPACFNRARELAQAQGDGAGALRASVLRLWQQFLIGLELSHVRQECLRLMPPSDLGTDAASGSQLQLLQRTMSAWLGEVNLEQPTKSASGGDRSPELTREMAGLLTCASLFFQDDFPACLAIAAGDWARPGSLASAEQLLYRALARARVAGTQTGEEREANLVLLGKEEQLAQELARHCPANHAHRHSLIAAELACLNADFSAALACYDRAIAAADGAGFLHHQALARERCAELHDARGRRKLAGIYSSHARAAYQRWGHWHKSTWLTRQLLSWGGDSSLPRSINQPSDTESSRTLDTRARVDAQGFDLGQALRAAQAITGELILDRIVQQLLQVMVHDNYCQQAVLALKRGHQLVIEATLSSPAEQTSVGIGREVRSHASLPAELFYQVEQRREHHLLLAADCARWLPEAECTARPLAWNALILPLLHRGRSIGVLYLERTASAFTQRDIELLQFLSMQAAVAIENAVLYETLEERVVHRVWELEEAYRQNVGIAHQAGMAQIAVEVLNNVGNLLNSLSVSSEFIAGLLAKSKIAELARATQLLGQHAEDIGSFLRSDAKGMPLLHYLFAVCKHLCDDRDRIAAELATASIQIHKLRNIVVTQQTYAGALSITEDILPHRVVEDALRLELPTPENAGIRLIREFAPTGSMVVDKHKLLQVLVQLIRNARQALGRSAHNPQRILVSIGEGDGDTIRFRISDTGIGVSPEEMPKIFNHGFTTTERNDGFGLHNSAIAVAEMHGTLSAESSGRDRGTALTLTLPRRAREPSLERGGSLEPQWHTGPSAENQNTDQLVRWPR